MSDLFKGFEQFIELVKTLEEKVENGEIKTDVQFNSRSLSSIPRTGNIPRTNNNTTSNVGTTSIRTPSSPARDTGASDPNIQPEGNLGITLKDIGGLNQELKELKELIAIPLKRPDLL
ncbi:AAA family ATPase, partial [Nodularia spumigena CS-587/03]|nr:AAA family ATPase [Nodularia spumigena CS-587/03]